MTDTTADTTAAINAASVATLPSALVLDPSIASDLKDANKAHESFREKVDAEIQIVLAKFKEEGLAVENHLRALWAKAFTSVGIDPDSEQAFNSALSAPDEGDSHIVNSDELNAHLATKALQDVLGKNFVPTDGADLLPVPEPVEPQEPADKPDEAETDAENAPQAPAQ